MRRPMFLGRLRRGPLRFTYSTGQTDELPLPSDSKPLPDRCFVHPDALREHALRTLYGGAWKRLRDERAGGERDG